MLFKSTYQKRCCQQDEKVQEMFTLQGSKTVADGWIDMTAIFTDLKEFGAPNGLVINEGEETWEAGKKAPSKGPSASMSASKTTIRSQVVRFQTASFNQPMDNSGLSGFGYGTSMDKGTSTKPIFANSIVAHRSGSLKLWLRNTKNGRCGRQRSNFCTLFLSTRVANK